MAARIGGIVLENVHNVSENGGMNAPAKKTEKGFSYSSHVAAEPIEASFDAWVTSSEYNRLTSLRDSKEPFKATVGLVSLGTCKLNDLSVTQDPGKYSHYAVTISVEQVTVAETGTATLSVGGDGGGGGGDGGGTKSGSSDGLDPTLVRSKEEDGPEETGKDPLGEIAGWMGF